MPIMAKWGPKTWEVSRQKVVALNSVSASVELDAEHNEDKAGSPAATTKALKPQNFQFDFDLSAVVGSDVRDEYESWTNLIGQYAPFYLAGRRFGPANVQLTAVNISNTLLDNFGRIVKGRVSISLTEYAEEASSKKASQASSGGSGGAYVAAGIATYNELGISPSALNIGPSSGDKAAKKPNNTQLSKARQLV